MQDDTNMISKKTSSKIKRKLYSGPELQRAFKLFVLRESYCKKDILELIDTFTKVIIKNSGFIDNQDLEDYTLDDFVNIADTYSNVMALLQNSFAAGLLYGRAKFDQNFWREFGASNHELEELLADHMETMGKFPGIREEEEDTSTEDFTDSPDDEDKDPLDDIF